MGLILNHKDFLKWKKVEVRERFGGTVQLVFKMKVAGSL